MKKILFLLLAALFVLTGCSKTTKCECTSVDNPSEIMLVNADRGMPCKKITKIGYERLVEGQLIRDLTEVTCKEAKD